MKEFVAYHAGLKIIDAFDYRYWRDEWIRLFNPDERHIEERSLRRVSFKLFINRAFLTVPREKFLPHRQAYRTYRNRLWGASDDQLTPKSLEELT